jgi:hypothetical protein
MKHLLIIIIWLFSIFIVFFIEFKNQEKKCIEYWFDYIIENRECYDFVNKKIIYNSDFNIIYKQKKRLEYLENKK